MSTPLELMRDERGSALVGWTDPGVLYTRLEGRLSAPVGAALAARVAALVGQVPRLLYYSDGSSLTACDLLARSALVRVVLANRRRFSNIVLLTTAAGTSSATTAFVAAVGEPIEVLTDPKEFDTRLVRAAPLARSKLDPSTWVRSKPSAAVLD